MELNEVSDRNRSVARIDNVGRIGNETLRLPSIGLVPDPSHATSNTHVRSVV